MNIIRKIPLHKAIRQAGDELNNLEKFVEICARALEQSTRAVEMVEMQQKAVKLLIEIPSRNPENEKETYVLMSEEELSIAKEKARKIEVFAQQQKLDGFPYMYSLAVVRLWTILEAMVDDLVVDFMRRPDKCKDKDLIYSLKGPVLEFATASNDQQAEFLAERLKDAVNAGLKTGVGRFEAMLEPIGLGGGIDPDVRRVIYELCQVRNLIVHKEGIADKRFVEACPWLNLKAGASLTVNAEDFSLYNLIAYYYVLELRLRTIHLSGYKENPEIQKIKEVLNGISDSVTKQWSERVEAHRDIEVAKDDDL